MSVTVQIDIEELPKAIQQRAAPNQQKFNKIIPGMKSSGWFDSLTTSQIIVIVGVVGVLVFLYFKYGKKEEQSVVSESRSLVSSDLVPKSSFVPASPASSASSASLASSARSSSRSMSSNGSSRDEPLIERLKKLNLSKK